MKSAVSIFGMLGLLLAGCATSLTAKGRADSDQKIAALESQVGVLNQRLEEMGHQQQALESEIRTLRKAQGVSQAAAEPSGKREKTLSVRQIQMALAKAGFYQGPIDGKSGPKTQEAIKTFQKSEGLTADGLVGSKTALSLSKYLEE